MSRFTVTATFTVETEFAATHEVVESEARTLLRNTIDRRTYGYGAGANGWQATIDAVNVEDAPEPEPTVTMTESALQAHIAACVAEALAAQQGQPAV